MIQCNKLIYKFSDSPADCAREIWYTMARHENVREEIVSFIESEIVPRYDGFDPAHRRDHVMTVMSQAMELYSLAPEVVKKEMDREVLLITAGRTTIWTRGKSYVPMKGCGSGLMTGR